MRNRRFKLTRRVKTMTNVVIVYTATIVTVAVEGEGTVVVAAVDGTGMPIIAMRNDATGQYHAMIRPAMTTLATLIIVMIRKLLMLLRLHQIQVKLLRKIHSPRIQEKITVERKDATKTMVEVAVIIVVVDIKDITEVAVVGAAKANASVEPTGIDRGRDQFITTTTTSTILGKIRWEANVGEEAIGRYQFTVTITTGMLGKKLSILPLQTSRILLRLSPKMEWKGDRRTEGNIAMMEMIVIVLVVMFTIVIVTIIGKEVDMTRHNKIFLVAPRTRKAIIVVTIARSTRGGKVNVGIANTTEKTTNEGTNIVIAMRTWMERNHAKLMFNEWSKRRSNVHRGGVHQKNHRVTNEYMY